MSYKDYYIKTPADDIMTTANELLCLEITKYHPKSVFEFGAGTGKNIVLLWKYNPDMSAYGCDLNPENIQKADKNGVWLEEGDEYIMQYYGNIDVVFTCDVLNHIPDIRYIVEQMKNLCNKAIVICEKENNHDYRSFGFEIIDEKYGIWKWKKHE